MISIKNPENYKSEKILSEGKIIKKVEEFKKYGKKIGLCVGGYDLLHPGQMIHLRSAKEFCDILIIGITCDKYNSKRKGEGRPVYNELLRAFSVSQLSCVDYAFICNYKKAVEAIRLLKPNYYIKGPDYINKTTPGIISERNTISEVGEEIKYTVDEKLSTTEIINYIQTKVKLDKDKKWEQGYELLIIIDRDGTIIYNDDFLGRYETWEKELKINKEVVRFLKYLQNKFTSKIICISNQSGVARKFFDCKRINEINNFISEKLKEDDAVIDNWQYCPDIDIPYAKKNSHLNFNYKYVKEKTKRKPCTKMVDDSLKELNTELKDFKRVIVIGNSEDDKQLAVNLKAPYIDSGKKDFNKLIQESNFL
ncbi:HAD-IIIA family hydrolase [Candidatus Pacearchaeota archaeon]|nr:HAD-IIIA family hydrolase [Candidatus Pacearchaeota archaeon]MBI2057074.1 HAD-IIIA family hydrolase [Candidatus Pacearchaeota archaeon]